MDDHFDNHPSFQGGDSGAGLGDSRFLNARMDNRFDNHPSSQCGGSGARHGGFHLHARMNDHSNNNSFSQHRASSAGLASFIHAGRFDGSPFYKHGGLVAGLGGSHLRAASRQIVTNDRSIGSGVSMVDGPV
jgi:hypothetical protein